MDAHGARVLKARIESQHWRRAGAVRSGRQPDADPDAELLLECRDDLRVYDGGREKRIVDGAWLPAALDRTAAA